MEYRLRLGGYGNTIALVGCGGTGGFAAEGLCRLLLGSPLRLVLIDGDRVEERNLARQNFYPEDLGRPKAQALAERLARKYRRPVGYSTTPFRGSLERCLVVVGCVDNAPARAAIARAVSPPIWWVDAGNGRDFGQVLVGNAKPERLHDSFDPREGSCYALPLPPLVRPELLAPEGRRPSCAQAVAIGEQGPTINQAMAALVVEVVRKLLEGKLGWWQVYLDLDAGTLHTVPATPQGVSRMTGIALKKLVRR